MTVSDIEEQIREMYGFRGINSHHIPNNQCCDRRSNSLAESSAGITLFNPDSALERNTVTVNCKSDDKVQNFLMHIVRNILEKIRA